MAKFVPIKLVFQSGNAMIYYLSRSSLMHSHVVSVGTKSDKHDDVCIHQTILMNNYPENNIFEHSHS